MNNDQAEKLRMRISLEKKEDSAAQVIGVASGKGGVGKSVFCVNFSIALGQVHNKVLIIDLDIGMGNIEQLMGKTAPLTIVDAIQRKLPFKEVVIEATSTVSFIAGGSGLTSLFHLNDEYLHDFLDQLEQLRNEYDFILFDFGAGASEDMFHFMLAVNRLILVTTPEPPAMADSYSVLKMVYARNQDLEVSFVVNQILKKSEGWETWQRISSVADRFLGNSPSWLAAIHRDNDLVQSVRKQVPCMLSHPQSRYCVDMQLLSKAFLIQCGATIQPKVVPSFADKVKKYLRLIGGKRA
ncbi:P-loop NTPase [Sporolactobacillus kofuensis]|uniref:P-loop NTPase n=1 Tax=Sporolactobacillus kofuensis TaxID=269672 RepID=A0ABW1WCS6_9BACL|nr:P-loop NTPase [Sporolactobacillus kofuensis]MCO7174709.1 P-loop NTPase [Sporolactobacillus kofuensis]